MSKIGFKITTFIHTSADTIYNAWLNGGDHTNMTGGEATGSLEVGEGFTAWDGYISGRNIALIPNEKIVQAWRTTEFDEQDQDSKLEIRLKQMNNGCEITLIHTEIPPGQPDYEKGWEEHYFQPMREYFEKDSKS